MFRNYLLLIYILLFSFQAFAQTLIPNSGFENWQDYDTLNQGHQLPSKWDVANTDSMFMQGYQGIVRKSSYAARGSYSLQMVIDSSNNIYDYETLENTFPFKGRPTSLRFFTAFSEPGNSATVSLTFYRIDTNGNWQPLGSGFSTFSHTKDGWVEEALNISYTDTTMPTRCHISFDYPSNAVGKKNISFYLDEISFSNNTSIAENLINNKEQIAFPCPADKLLSLKLSGDAKVQIIDMLGKSVYSRIFAPGLSSLATDNLPNGFYLLYIVYASGQTEIDKIIINHP